MSPLFTLVLLSLSMFTSVGADPFVWRHSSNWANPANWKQARLPCAAETVKLAPFDSMFSVPLGQKFEVRVDVNVTLKRLVLSKGSSLKLNKDTQLTLSKKADCREIGLPAMSDSSVNEFIAVQPHPWNCPNNWERLSDKKRAVKVPCESDTVHFLSGRSYSWIKLDTNIKVAGIQWQGNPVQSLSEISNAEAYFVRANPSADLTASAMCVARPSACPCLPNDCSLYPTSPLPPTTKTMRTTKTTRDTGISNAMSNVSQGSGSPGSSAAAAGSSTTISSSPCAASDEECVKIISKKDTNTGSSSRDIWPIIVGAVVGVVALLIVAIIALVLFKRKHSGIYKKKEIVGFSNAAYSSNADEPKVEQSFQNPMYAEHANTHDDQLYMTLNDAISQNDEPKVEQSFQNPIYTEDANTHDDHHYITVTDAIIFQNVAGESDTSPYQEFDEDGLPI